MIDIESERGDELKTRIPQMLLSPSAAHERHERERTENETEVPSFWETGPGVAVLALGVALPAATLAVSATLSADPIWHLILKSPIETLTQCALASSVPVANLLTWSAISRKDSRRPIRLGITNGMTIGTTLTAAVIATAAVVMSYPTFDQSGSPHLTEFSIIAGVSWITFGIALYLAERLRQAKETRGARLRTLLYSLLGVLVSLAAFAGSEARNTFIRFAEHMATADSAKDRDFGLQSLRALGPEKDLRMACADPKSAGLTGLFLRQDDATSRQLYFATTGKPYKHNETADISMQSNDYLHRHVVGAAISGLSLTRSKMTGSLNPNTLSSSLDWTFVFKNRTFSQQEARAEIVVPPGAVISGLTLWIDGEPRKAAFGTNDTVRSAHNQVAINDRAPAMITDLGRGRALLQCSPIPAQGELKVKVTVTAPLKLESTNEATLNLPKLLDSNFSVAGDHSLRLRSTEAMEASHEKIHLSKAPTGEQLLVGTLKDNDLADKGLTIRVKRSGDFGAIAAYDAHSSKGSYLVETIKEMPSRAPKHLVVVVDGSQSVKEHRKEISEALAHLPKNISTSLIIASDKSEGQGESMPLATGLEKIKKLDFSGGHDNLLSLIKASEEAGDTSNGAVLWIHGPQPGFNQEIYIMTPFSAAPSFYDLDVEAGGTNFSEFLKNHREIGPFTPIARTATVGRDLERFIAKWQPNGKEFVVNLATTTTKPTDKIASPQEAKELATLWANRQCQSLIASANRDQAAALAVRYQLVTPVTGATVLESKADDERFGLSESRAKQAAEQWNLPKWIDPRQALRSPVESAFNNTSAQLNNLSSQESSQTSSGTLDQPLLQGASNGTVGSLGSDPTIVLGLNTAGTVRVNNLANLESLLNITANLTEVLVLGMAIYHFVMGALGKRLEMLLPFCPIRLSPKLRLLFALALGVCALSVPGVINWLLASSRDANLFD
jgi:hypothetical protein